MQSIQEKLTYARSLPLRIPSLCVVAVLAVSSGCAVGPQTAYSVVRPRTTASPVRPVAPDPITSWDLVGTAYSADRFNRFLDFVRTAGLLPLLRDRGPYTVFAPMDEAFDRIPERFIEQLLEPKNLRHLQAVLMYHLVPGDLRTQRARNMTLSNTMEGTPLHIMQDNGWLYVNSATVVDADIGCSNGVLHGIDELLIPPSVFTALHIPPRSQWGHAVAPSTQPGAPSEDHIVWHRPRRSTSYR